MWAPGTDEEGPRAPRTGRSSTPWGSTEGGAWMFTVRVMASGAEERCRNAAIECTSFFPPFTARRILPRIPQSGSIRVREVPTSACHWGIGRARLRIRIRTRSLPSVRIHEWLSAGSDSRCSHEGNCMCRNIKTLFNFEPPASDDEIVGASLQFVRKISGFNKPSRANEAAFHRAVEDVATAAGKLLDSLVSDARPRDRETEGARARARASERFGVSARVRVS